MHQPACLKVGTLKLRIEFVLSINIIWKQQEKKKTFQLETRKQREKNNTKVAKLNIYKEKNV